MGRLVNSKHTLKTKRFKLNRKYKWTVSSNFNEIFCVSHDRKNQMF